MVMAESRKLRCCICKLWVDLGVISDEDFERIVKIGAKCGDCVTAAVIDYEEEDY